MAIPLHYIENIHFCTTEICHLKNSCARKQPPSSPGQYSVFFKDHQDCQHDEICDGYIPLSAKWWP